MTDAPAPLDIPLPCRWHAPGQAWPLGVDYVGSADTDTDTDADLDAATVLNVAVWAPDAEAVELCVFDRTGRTEQQRLFLVHNTDGVWHARVALSADGETGLNAAPELVYGWRVHGPWQPGSGHRFNPAKVLLDPWAREVVGCYGSDLSLYRGDQAGEATRACPRDNAAVALKGRWRLRSDDEAGDRTAHGRRHGSDHKHSNHKHSGHRIAWDQTVLYEAHVKGLTQQHPLIPPDLRGTYAGVAHPVMLAHYRRLGITTLNLLPVHARADEARLQGLGLSNYWGYSSIGFLAPEPRYAASAARAERGADAPRQDQSDPAPAPAGDVVEEFRRMVAKLHAAGLEVVLDVVFNHSAETDEAGPTLSLRGLANARYYRLRADDPALYENWTGCGNCLDLTQPRVLELVLGSLRYWAVEMGVDGFRFDLAPILARDSAGRFDPRAPFLAALQADPVLSTVKWIAEPWDIGPDGYQLGAFPVGWREWNDRFRDDMRDAWLGRHAAASNHSTRAGFAQRFAASSAQFHHSGRTPDASVNFITAHDGYTLRDLVSYEHKHNLENGEHNRDGHGENRSWNGGVEGPSDDALVLRRRLTLSRSLLVTLLLSRGTPMLLAGDELGHSQQGNNNAYCQDNAITWLDWNGPDAADLCATVARLTALRRTHPALRQPGWLSGQGDVRWLHPTGEPLLGDADWHGNEPGLMIELVDLQSHAHCWLLCNTSAQPLHFTLPTAPAAWLSCVFDSAFVGGDGKHAPRESGQLQRVACAAHAMQVWTDEAVTKEV